MNIDEFFKKWFYSRITLDLGVDLDGIKTRNKEIKQLYGKEAWDKMYSFYPPSWDEFAKPFRTQLKSWFNKDNLMYKRIIDEESTKGTVKFYEERGLTDYNFCVFASSSDESGVLVDGCHRFILLNYLQDKGLNLDREIKKIVLDVIYLDDLGSIIPKDNVENLTVITDSNTK